MDYMALRFAGPLHWDANASDGRSGRDSELARSCPPEPSAPSSRGRQSSRLGRNAGRGSVAAELLGGVERPSASGRRKSGAVSPAFNARDTMSVTRSPAHKVG